MGFKQTQVRRLTEQRAEGGDILTFEVKRDEFHRDQSGFERAAGSQRGCGARAAQVVGLVDLVLAADELVGLAQFLAHLNPDRIAHLNKLCQSSVHIARDGRDSGRSGAPLLYFGCRRRLRGASR